jgi:acyl CoA:acetate/3-ketoacid CoA transferase beta subunit
LHLEQDVSLLPPEEQHALIKGGRADVMLGGLKLDLAQKLNNEKAV